MVVDLGSFKYIFNRLGHDCGSHEVQQQDEDVRLPPYTMYDCLYEILLYEDPSIIAYLFFLPSCFLVDTQSTRRFRSLGSNVSILSSPHRRFPEDKG